MQIFPYIDIIIAQSLNSFYIWIFGGTLVTDLMTQKKERLHELYDFSKMKSSSINSDVYMFEADANTFIFLDEMFKIDYRKFDQLKNLSDLRSSVLYGDLQKKADKVCVGFYIDKLVFFFGDLKFAIRKNQTLENIYIDLFNNRYTFSEMLAGSAYDKCYSELLRKLQDIMPKNITLKEFIDKLALDYVDIITSKIPDNSFVYMSEDELKSKYIETNDGSNSIKFDLHPKSIRKALSPFFSKSKLDDIVSVFYPLAFYINLTGSKQEFNSLKGFITLEIDPNKFKDHYDCYTINIEDTPSDFHRFFVVTTENHFISYRKIDIRSSHNFKTISFDGVDNIHKALRDDIAEIFKKNLDIAAEEINIKDFEILKMARF